MVPAPILSEEEASVPMLANEIQRPPESMPPVTPGRDKEEAASPASVAPGRDPEEGLLPANGRSLEGSAFRPSCLVATTIFSLAVVALLGAGGVWLTADPESLPPDEESITGDSRMLLLGPTGTDTNATSIVTTADADTAGCDLGCQLQSWKGWKNAEHRLHNIRGWAGQALPFIESTTSTTTTATTTTVTTTKTSSTSTGTATKTKTTTSKTTSTATKTTTTKTTTTPTPACVTPAEGGDCFKEVVHAMHDIQNGADDFGDLNVWSSFEEVQDHLHAKGSSACAASCKCETAQFGSHCYDSVLYARKIGVHEHPEWYHGGLKSDSPVEDFQLHLWENDTASKCPRPCKAPWKADTSIFCWSVARNVGYEADVMKVQLEAGAGIFNCDGFAVVSEKHWVVGKGPGKRIGTVKTVTFNGAEVGISKDGTAANTQLFINAWEAVIDKTFILEYDWVLKVDPDAVVLADRLRTHLAQLSGSVYVRNCNKVPESADFPMMFGSLEVLSRAALQTYADNSKRCQTELDWSSWGEDYYLGKCLTHLGVQPADDFGLISDGVCTGVNCQDGWSAAFHPFKSGNDWMTCWNTATAGKVVSPPTLPALE